MVGLRGWQCRLAHKQELGRIPNWGAISEAAAGDIGQLGASGVVQGGVFSMIWTRCQGAVCGRCELVWLALALERIPLPPEVLTDSWCRCRC